MTPRVPLHRYNGKYLSTTELAALTGVHKSTFLRRLNIGMSVDQAVAIGQTFRGIRTGQTRRERTKRPLHMYKGEPRRIIDVAAETGIHARKLCMRVHRGASLDEAVARGLHAIPVPKPPKPPQPKKPRGPDPRNFITFRGETLTKDQWAARLGISKASLDERLRSYRWTFEDALTVPRVPHGVALEAFKEGMATASPSAPGGYEPTLEECRGTGVGSFTLERGQSAPSNETAQENKGSPA